MRGGTALNVDGHSMSNLTYAALCAMPDDEQIADERIALIIEGDHCTEDEARARVERRQGELFNG